MVCGAFFIHQGADVGVMLRLTPQYMYFKGEEENQGQKHSNQGQEDIICSLIWWMGSKRDVLLINVNC